MKLIKCPDPECGAYNDASDTNCQRCYASLGTQVHAREAKKNQKPKKQKWDDEETTDESLENDRYKEHGRRNRRRDENEDNDDSV